MQDHAFNKYFTKQELENISKCFTPDQQKDVLDLGEQCAKTPRGRIRKPRVRKAVPGHIGRPINSFMAYRSKVQSDIRQFCPTANHRVISKIIAKWWRAIDEKEKDVYRVIADKAKKDHLEKHPGYTFRPKPKKNKKPAVTKTKEADKSATQEDAKDLDYMPSPRFYCRVEREHSYQQEQQHQPLQGLLAYAGPDLNEGASSLYFQPTVNYASVSLGEDGLNLDTNSATMYVDPALLHNGYMDINAAEPISFSFETDPAMFTLLSNSTPSSQMLETPSLDYFQSPISLSHPALGHQSSGYQQTMQQAMQQQQQQQQQQQDTPYLLDQTVIPADYSNEYGKLFDSLDSSSSASSSDLLRTPNNNIQVNTDFVSYMYGAGNPNIIFAEQPEQWLNYNIN
ncbi:Ribosome production factor 1 [Mucor velutinosus]|uniref:Ribosome production factor 1 n=1 Tax=Mucor velutinosus TaxID=708070 RepID=A0AAN7HXP5_9FUNG|nr:Ribosome production factor 1 [Mucor velutinosus]